MKCLSKREGALFRNPFALLTAILLAGTMVHAQEIDLESDLDVYWTFDEMMGDFAGDISDNERGAQIPDIGLFADDSILWIQGQFGGAIDFDGNYALAAQEYYGVGGTEPRTISMWIRTDWAVDTGANATMGWGPNVNQQRWHFKLEAGSGALRTENQGGNNIAEIPVNNGEWHHIASVFPDGGSVIGDVDHYVDGVLDPTKNGGVDNPVDTNVDPAVAPEVMVGGSTFGGGYRFTIAAIDDVRIYNRALSAEEIAALAEGQGVRSGSAPSIGLPDGIRGATFYSAADGLPVSVTAVGEVTVSADQVSMTVNGEDVTDQLTSSGSDTELDVQFDGLEDNRSYQVSVTASDSDGITSTRRFSFSTFREDNFIVEAENYNFDGGQFIDDPVLCNTLGGEPDCYFDKISQPGIDSFDSMGHSDDSDQFDQVYRFAAEGADRVEEFDTFVSDDVLRDKYDGVQGSTGPVQDYDINLLNAGDWANYTRTFPDQPGYRVFLRVQAQAEQDVRLDLVTSDPSAADQTVELLGYFKPPVGSTYSFVPLTDLAGENELSVILSGEQTLRLTTEQADADININYMMFVPTEETSILPSATVQSPADGSVFANNADITLTAEASDEDGTVSNVIFTAEKDGQQTVIGEVSSEPYEVVWSGVAPGIYTVTAEAVDNDGLSGLSDPITIIVDSDPPEIVEVRSSPSLDAIEVIFNEPIDPDTGDNAANYTLDPSLTVNSAVTDGRKVVLTTGTQSAGTDYSITIQNVEDRHGNAVAADPVSFTASESNLFFGLELYLTFDEGSGEVVQDLSGFDRDGTIFDDPLFADASILWSEGNFGGAVEFDETYFLNTPDYRGVGGTNPRTISAWIKKDTPPIGGNTIVGWGPNANQERWHFRLQDNPEGALRTENQGGNNFGEVSVNDGQWHHIASVFPAGGSVIGDVDHYVDGVLDSVKNGGVDNPVATNIDPEVAPPLSIGGAPFGGGFRFAVSELDDVRIYSRALSGEEITALANGEGVLDGGSGPSPEVSISRAEGGAVTIGWSGDGVLQTAPAVTGEWTDVTDPSNPITINVDETAFYRVVVQQ